MPNKVYQKTSLNILMVHPHDIYSYAEPWTIRITALAKEFASMGHKVKLVYFPLDKKKRDTLRKKFLEFETIPYNRRRIDIPINMLKMLKLAEWADIIHVQKCYPEAVFPAVFSAYILGKPLHYDWDDWEYKIYVLPSPSRKPILKTEAFFLKLLETNLPKLSDTMSVASDELMMMALELGVSKQRIIKANVCADLKRFSPKNKPGDILKKYDLKKPLVTYLGQLHGAQYAELFIKAGKMIEKNCPDAQFLIIGGGDDLERLKEYAIKKGPRHITFSGYISDDDVDKLLAATDIAVACFMDTQQQRCKSPLKIAEYMAAGKAIVASDVGEVNWMIGDCGILVKASNPISLGIGIRQLLKDETVRHYYEINARKRAEEIFNWKKVADAIISSYFQVI